MGGVGLISEFIRGIAVSNCKENRRIKTNKIRNFDNFYYNVTSPELNSVFQKQWVVKWIGCVELK